ncbi:hypothetical protein KC678_02340 [Candidatus Dojkabacteria bacterium]|uniref:Uncharacterized protein n=1 Tax=Candidatus Dojkabacteria bacterium TaxID=2099670 RepID=A0A955L1B7_9BACT|nr:hypothetical protein [Candidatus Dojkabacteria bacterium]
MSNDNPKGKIPTEDDAIEPDLIDEDLLDDEFSDGYEEGYTDGAGDLIISSAVESVYRKREDTRSRLALIYTIFTFFVFIFAMVIAVLDGLVRKVSIIDNLSVVIPLISGVFLGTLGFVLGYYFRREEEKDSTPTTD